MNNYIELFKKAQKETEIKEMKKIQKVWWYDNNLTIHFNKNTKNEIVQKMYNSVKSEIKGITLEIVENTLPYNYVSKNSTFYNEIENVLKNEKDIFTKIEK